MRLPANFDSSKTSVISGDDDGTLKGKSVAGKLDNIPVPADKESQSKKGGVKIRGSANNVDETSDFSVKASMKESTTLGIDSADERLEGTSASKGRHGYVDESGDSFVNKGQSLTGNMSSLGLYARPSSTNTRKATSKVPYKSEDWMFYNEAEDALIQLNLAIVSKEAFSLVL